MEADNQFLEDFQKLIGTTDLKTSGFYDESSSEEFHVIDAPPLKITGRATFSFEIKNPNQTLIHLLAIDKGFDALLSEYSGKRPEGVLFNKQEFCFVELKLDVVTLSEMKQTKRIQEAIAKFDNFIADLKTRFSNHLSKDFMSSGFTKYEAYIVLRSGQYPLDSNNSILRSKYPSFSSSTAKRKRAFGMRHKNIELFETNIKEFS